MNAVALTDEAIEAVAQRVAEILRGEPTEPGSRLVDAAEIARRFSISRDTVYARANELGAVRIGGGPRARLRFDPAVVAERLAPPATPTPTPPQHSPRRHRRPESNGVDLLPIRGRTP